jgi:hypothetical protein
MFLQALNRRVGIGTTAPAYKLDVTGDIRASAAILGQSLNVTDNIQAGYGLICQTSYGLFVSNTRNGSVTNTGIQINYNATSGQNAMAFYYGGVIGTGIKPGTGAFLLGAIDNLGNLVMTGDVTAFSDSRLKKDVSTVGNALDKIENIRGVSFTRTDTNKKGYGVIAQELQNILPELVLEGGDDNKYLSVNYNGLSGIFIEAIKELKQMIVSLQTEIEALKK